MGSPKKRIQYRFDAVGNRVGMTDPDGGRFTYAYDAVNRITQVINPQGERTSYAYDAGGRRTVKKLANGTRASFSYDAASNLTRLANLKSDGTTISSFNYDYDRVGNRTAVLEADGSRVTWSYDDTYQLTGEHRTGTTPYEDSYSYDAAGNRLLKIHDGARTTYSYDAANQLEWSEGASGRTTYTFDADGNQQLVVEPTGDRTTTSWDYENRIVSLQLPSNNSNTFTYEPNGLRLQLREPASVTHFIWDDTNCLAQTSDDNDTTVAYTTEPLPYGLVVSQVTNGGASTFHFDATGSTREVTNSGEIETDTRLYNYWGQIAHEAGATSFAFQFLGRSGLMHFTGAPLDYSRRREYSPTLARTLSPIIASAGTQYGARTPIHTLAALDAHGRTPLYAASGSGAALDEQYRKCIRDCEEACAREYDKWYEFPALMGCVALCPGRCQGRRSTIGLLQSYLAHFTPCQADLLHCTCLMIEAESSIVNYILAQLGPLFPPGIIVCVVNALTECLCDALVGWQAIGRGRGGVLLGASAVDCLMDVFACGLGHSPDLLLYELGKDLFAIIINALAEQVTFGNFPCCHLLEGNCGDEIFGLEGVPAGLAGGAGALSALRCLCERTHYEYGSYS
jgi:YD repeat-containing protein